MKSLFLLVVFLAGVSAQAARPNTQNMTAAQAKALVEKHGSIALSTSSFGYDRFVAKPYMCGGDRAIAAYVPTLDSDAAFIGYSCSSRSGEGTSFSKTYRRNPITCREGKTQTFHETREGGEGEVAVARVCSNGKWKRMGVDPVGPKKSACREGTYRTVKISRGGGELEETRLCRDGQWYGVN